ncbi:conserved hypothetical protein [Methylocella silvestris BL2]|uniref:Uncharacterized protein n=1 Tax=Methylocella silvestris (strain DSM 15510 / CIP 108128 / LMG 27833 / NCIMB 13906 / BL2) TaxID=395965 RepID=B8ESG1_METSB|nr:conserved hypothetical protein [Methylocella silvestris BL2]
MGLHAPNEVESMSKAKASWARMATNAIKLSVSAPAVIALRMAKVSFGGAAAKRESKRMVSEKVKAAFDTSVDAAWSIASGKARQVPGRAIAFYQKRVAENLRRLSKGG